MDNSNTIGNVAKLVDRRIYALGGRRSQKEIAHLAGLSSNMISMIRHGRNRLPIEHAVNLAGALECDPAHLFRLALEESLAPSVLDNIRTVYGVALSRNEVAILDLIRTLSRGSDPGLTNAIKEALSKALTGGKEG